MTESRWEPLYRFTKGNWTELLLISLCLVTFSIAATAVCTRNPPHADEVMIAETAYNMARGEGMISYACKSVNELKKQGSIAPLHAYVSSIWLRCVGLSSYTVVALNVITIGFSGLFLWSFLLKTNAIKTRFYRVACVLCVLQTAPLLAIYGNNRYDIFGCLSFSVILLSFTLKKGSLRAVLLTLSSTAAALSGPAVSISLVVMVSLAFILFREIRWTSAFCYLGIVLGVSIGLGRMLMMDELASFLAVLEQNDVQRSVGFSKFLSSIILGHTAKLLLVVTAAITLSSFTAKENSLVRRLSVFGLLIGVSIPTVLTFAGRYTGMYQWLAITPMLTSTAISISQYQGRLPRILGGFALVTICSLGLPLSAMKVGLEWDSNSRMVPHSYIEKHLSSSDVVYADYSAYYPVKRTAQKSYFGAGYWAMTAEEKSAVNVVVLEDRSLGTAMDQPTMEDVFEGLGGKWSQFGIIKIPRSALRMRIPPEPKEKFLYHFTLYRKESD